MDKKMVNASVMDFLSMEMVKYVQRTTSENGGKEAIYYKLEKIGFEIGQRFVEKRSCDRKRFHDHLEIIKFVCTEVWNDAYGKQIDNLRTNHRGVYVLVDNRFQCLRFMSGEKAEEEAIKYVSLPCGIIRGALSMLGLQSTVTPDCAHFPGCSFTIKTTTS